jgi:type IV pilus assembly protein PilY1
MAMKYWMALATLLVAKSALAVDLADIPLREARTGEKVLPNIMVILDESTSMGSNSLQCDVGDGKGKKSYKRIKCVKAMVKQVFDNVCNGDPNDTGYKENCIPARVGLHTINNKEKDTNSSYDLDGNTCSWGCTKPKHVKYGNFMNIQDFDQATKIRFNQKVDGIPLIGSTPLAYPLSEVGLYFANNKASPLISEAKGTDPIQYSCQKNYTILFTDGDANDKNYLDLNNKNKTGSNAFKAVKDAALLYHDNDLRSDMKNDVVEDNKTTFQHMSTFIVSLSANHTEYKEAAEQTGGKYFYTTSAEGIAEGFRSALVEIAAQQGSGAAAVTDDDQRVGQGHSVFSARYETGGWTGDLVRSGLFADKPLWSAADALKTRSPATRAIWTDDKDAPGSRIDFASALSSTVWNAHHCASGADCLSQFGGTGGVDASKASAQTLTDWLRGSEPSYVDANKKTVKLYRERTTPLGDIVHATPVFLPGSPNLVLAAANDGMLHAFNADSGKEEWAWIPSVLLPDLWRLADKSYPARHRFYLDGPLQIVEAEGKTLLIGSFGAGAKGYYALDLSDRLKPALLWNFTDADAGYALNPAQVAQVGTRWVALLPSGVNATDGKARLFEVDLLSGTTLKTFEPAASNAENGLSAIALYQPDAPKNRQTRWAFGGDLQGNLWRFDLQEGTSARVADLGGPITAEPIVSLENQEIVLYVGTGRYLGRSDLTDTTPGQLFGVKTGVWQSGASYTDSVFHPDHRFTLSGNTIQPGSGWRWADNDGFTLKLASKERVWQKAELVFGLLAFLSVTPDSSACSAGGKSALYLINVKTGQGTVQNFDKSIVGMEVVMDANGNFSLLVQYDDGTTELIPIDPPDRPKGKGGLGKRLGWRMLQSD